MKLEELVAPLVLLLPLVYVAGERCWRWFQLERERGALLRNLERRAEQRNR